ncbi:MAG: hypothetical protein HY279_06920 [Nitrospinae bacterium]|nr:hypothetical protein [Nitrospinota bacterium]
MLFGEYLIKIEKISEDELNFALEFQRDDNVMSAVSAIGKGYLTYGDVSKIMDYMRETDMGFEETSVSLGLLNKEEIKIITDSKGKTHYRIGELLVMCGSISKVEMEVELLNFKNISIQPPNPLC